MKQHHHPLTSSKDCRCKKKCIACSAEKLSIACGCDFEAKRYEYGVDHTMRHTLHEGHRDVKKDEDAVPDMSKMSHMDHEAAMTDPMMAKAMERDMRRRFWIALILSVPIFLYAPVGEMIFGGPLPSPIPVHWLLFILTTPVVFWSGSIFITGAYRSLVARKLNMSVLIATGVLAAYLFSVFLTFSVGGETFYEAAALLVTFVLFGHWMEMKSRRGTSESLRALFDLVPPQATVLRHGKALTISTAEIVVGDIVLIRPGDKIPVDGEVTDGTTLIDESLVTGESIPIAKKVGDRVVGGSMNQNGSIQFRATSVGGDTALAQIIKLVETAQNSKAPGQRIADKAAGILVIVAISVGIVTFFGWFFFGHASLITALTFAVSAIVIACPDALGLATPTVVAVGTGIGARHNILIKNAITLERASRIQVVVLDKTGTLTEGKPKVTEIAHVRRFSEQAVLSAAASVEKKSNHPISKAILDEAEKRSVEISSVISDFEAIGGHGVQAMVGGKRIFVGTEKLMNDQKISLHPLRSEIDRLLASGNTISLIAIDGLIAGAIGVADQVKADAKKAIVGMRALGLEVAMMTGDHERVAQAVARELGIERVFAQVLPEEKEKYIQKLQKEGKFVAMVGDGINDAPALARADIGIAIGAGTDVAIETASIVLMRSDPMDVLAAIMLSKATVVKMKQNLFWAAIYNILAIPVAAGVFYPAFGWVLRPEISALLMSGSSVIVAINAILLKRVERRLNIL